MRFAQSGGNYWRDHRGTYQSWHDMMVRCYVPGTKSYKHYGDRGIQVCKRWHEVANFFADMGDKPQGMTLHRLNNDKNYSKRNCKWATRKEQAADNRGLFKKGHKPSNPFPKGNVPPFVRWGFVPVEVRQKMSAKAKIRAADPVWRTNHSVAMLGRKHSAQTKQKMSAAQKLAWRRRKKTCA